MQNIHLKLEQSATPVSPGTPQRQDSLYGTLNNSLQMSPFLVLLVLTSRSNAAWRLTSTDLHHNRLHDWLGSPFISREITPTFGHILSSWHMQAEVTFKGRGAWGGSRTRTNRRCSLITCIPSKAVQLFVAAATSSPAPPPQLMTPLAFTKYINLLIVKYCK